MINKKEFDLLLKQIVEVENKIEEVKILNKFDKANEFEKVLEIIKRQAKEINLDNTNSSKGLDQNSLDVLSDLILLSSNVDFYILKTNGIIESANESKIDVEALKKVEKLWSNLENTVNSLKNATQNPIEEIENNKKIGRETLEIIIFQLQTFGIIDFTMAFKYCKVEYLVNAIKEVLYDGAKNEIQDEIKRRIITNLAKNLAEKDIYDYKLWQQILMIKNVRSRDDHIEIIGNPQDKEKAKQEEVKDIKEEPKNENDDDQNMELFFEDSIFVKIKKWFYEFMESSNQRKMDFSWSTPNGPAFKLEFTNGDIWYSKDHLDESVIEKTKKLTIATNGVGKYILNKNINFKNLEEIEFLEKKNSSAILLSPDRTYNCIGNDVFANCKKLKNINFGKIEMIGERAFKNCNSLTELTFSKSLMNIGDDAFLDCSNLRKVTFLGDLKLYILKRPQNVLNCFKGTNLEEIVFANIESAFDFAITDCPHLKNIFISSIHGISIPFKICKYRLNRQEGIVSFVGEKSLDLWKKKNVNIRFFELTDEDKEKYNIY